VSITSGAMKSVRSGLSGGPSPDECRILQSTGCRLIIPFQRLLHGCRCRWRIVRCVWSPGTPPLSGIAIFDQDGTFQVEDGGDFGQMGFTGKNLTQYGTWRRDTGGEVVGVSLFLEANAMTAEVEKWVRGRFRYFRTDDRDVVAGYAEGIAELPCDLGLPFSAISCPDPIENADDFVAVGPADVPIVLKRLLP